MFNHTQQVAWIQYDIFKRLRFESLTNTSFEPTEDTVFTVWLEYPSQHAEIGYRDHVIIHYFDSPDLADVHWTVAQYTDPITGTTYMPDDTDSVESSPVLALGEVYTIRVFANYLDGKPKTNGNEFYYIIVRDILRKQVREVLKSTYIPDLTDCYSAIHGELTGSDCANIHELYFPVEDL